MFYCVKLKKEVSPANDLGLENKSSNISLIYIKENSAPGTEPRGAPARTLVHDDVRPLRTALYLQFLENILLNEEDFPVFRIDLIWESSLSAILCQKLDVSRKTPQTLRPLSNEW